MKKIGIVALVLVLALGAIGVGYAHWSQTLKITEEVNTGKFCVGILDIGTDDPGPSLADGGLVYPTVPAEGTVDPGYTKNVASADSYNVGDVKCTHEGVDFYHEVREVIKNAYPSYRSTIFLLFANCGTVPAKGSGGFVQKVVSDPMGLAPYVEFEYWEMQDDTGVVASGSTVAELDAALKAYQLDPCNRLWLIITKHITQQIGDVMAPQEATVVFEETVVWNQWNYIP
jgi:hypothetical protein